MASKLAKENPAIVQRSLFTPTLEEIKNGTI